MLTYGPDLSVDQSNCYNFPSSLAIHTGRPPTAEE